MKRTWTCIGLIVAMTFVVGCGQGPSRTVVEVPSGDGERFLLAVEPEGAQDVIQARETAADGDEVVVVGRIGGSADPWIEGRAVFSIVDGSLKACSDIPGDQCETPWDYCCETHKLPAATALVKVVDENGEPVNEDADRLLNVKELATVVVRGKAQRDDAGNFVILADGIHVRK